MSKFDSLNDLCSFMQSQYFDKKLSSYKSGIYPIDKLPYDKGHGPFLNYILDWQTGKYEHLSEGIKDLTGYDQEFIDRGVEGLFQIMHPNDAEAFQKMVSKWMELLLGKSEQEFNSHSGNLNFRVKKKNGAYMNLLQQPVYMTFDRKGNIVYEAGVMTDITRYRSDGNISLVIFGPDGHKIVSYYPKEDFAPQIATIRNKTTELSRLSDQSRNTFLRVISKVLVAQADNQDFNVENFSKEINFSRSKLYRRLKTVVGLTPHRLIRIYRLQQSLEYLAQNNLQISEIAYRVGFNSPAYFSKCFGEEFECTPTVYQEQVK